MLNEILLKKKVWEGPFPEHSGLGLGLEETCFS
jgi:hypothetical protein